MSLETEMEYLFQKENKKSLEKLIYYINDNYENIISKIKTNRLPTKKSFIKELKEIIFD